MLVIESGCASIACLNATLTIIFVPIHFRTCSESETAVSESETAVLESETAVLESETATGTKMMVIGTLSKG